MYWKLRLVSDIGVEANYANLLFLIWQPLTMAAPQETRTS
jgi:hypothetical protein